MEDLQQNDSTGMIASLADVELYARKLACEAVQVAAVARKYSETMATQKEADLQSDLKPCPFCGGEAELRDGFAYLDTTKYVTCKNCHTRTIAVLINHPSFNANGLDESTRYTPQQAEQKVRDMWNRRYHHD